MSANPLGELDMELDEVLHREERKRWRRYSFAIGVTLGVSVVWALALIMMATLVLLGEPFAMALVVFAAAGAVVSVFGRVLVPRTRRRWRQAHELAEGR